MKARAAAALAVASAWMWLAAPAVSQVILVPGQVRPDSLAAQFRLEFAVPDAPAFTLLHTDPSDIVRPVSVREFAIAVSDFIGDGSGVTIPRAFAVEVSPGLLIGGKNLTLAAYQKNPALYRLRVSLATHRPEDSGGPTELAAGLRVNLIDESDLRTNMAYITSATGIADSINRIYEAARERTGPPPTPILLSDAEIAAIAELEAPPKDMWTRQKWNARMLEFAAGYRASAADSTGQELRSQEAAGWATFATGFGSWGQLLLGGRIATSRDSVTDRFSAAGSLSSRFYVGTNRTKVFIEAGADWREGDDTWLLSSGGESVLFGQTWVSFTAGLEGTGSQGPALKTSLAIKLGGFAL